MDTSTLTDAQQTIRMFIRNFFLTAIRSELVEAMPNYFDQFSKDCIQELIDEIDEEIELTPAE